MIRQFAFCLLFATATLHAVDKPATTANPPGRDTTTGRVFEKMIEAALQQGGYTVSDQSQVGTRPNGGKHMVDLVARKGDTAILISLKWQQSGGTAEQKIPYEVICLSEALAQSQQAPGPAGKFTKACIVMGGDGWTLREWYLSGALKKHLPASKDVDLYSVDTFIANANKGKL